MRQYKLELPTEANALSGREKGVTNLSPHHVLETPLTPPYPEGYQTLVLGLGCFWGAERLFWNLPGVHTTAVGYAGGFTPNPSYQEVCTGLTAHTEVVKVVFDPEKLDLEELLKIFWESHDPTQSMRQGNDIGTQYRSAIYWQYPEHENSIRSSMSAFQTELNKSNKGVIQTELRLCDDFYFAEDYHQQYLSKNPNGYCGLAGTGVCFPRAKENA